MYWVNPILDHILDELGKDTALKNLNLNIFRSFKLRLDKALQNNSITLIGYWPAEPPFEQLGLS